MIFCSLAKNEQSLCQSIARKRYENAREKGFNGKLGSGFDKVTSHKDVDVDGVGSEMAAAKVLNVYYDIETDFQANELPTHDLMYKGKTVDVKTTKYKTGRLIVMPHKKNDKCELYLLVVGEFPDYYVVGCATYDEIVQEDNWGNPFGRGKPAYFLDQHKLTPVEDLIDEMYCV